MLTTVLRLLQRLLLLLLQAIFLAESWLRARRDGARCRCQQVLNSILDSVPFPFSLPLDWLLPRPKQTTGRVPGPPRAIALVLAEADLSKPALQRVAEVIGWCTQNGLMHISVYDPRGHVKAQRSDLAQLLSTDGRVASSYAFSSEAGYPLLAQAGDGLPSLRGQSKEANGSEMDEMTGQSPRSYASDYCSVSSLNTSPETSPVRSRPNGQAPSASSTVEVTLLSAEDAHAPLVAAARQGRISGPGRPPTADKAASNGDARRSGATSSLLPSKLPSSKADGQRARGGGEQKASSSALIAARPPSRLATAVAVAKAESSGDLMGFLSMLAAGQTSGASTAEMCTRDDSSLRLEQGLSRESFPNGCNGACSEASTSSFTLGSGGNVQGRTAGVSGSGGVVRSSSLDLFDGDTDPAAWLSANGDGGAADGEDWVAKKGSLRWIRQRAVGAEVDGGGPIRRRARRGNRARGEMGYSLLRSPWSWGSAADAGADKQFVTEPDQDTGMFRSVSNGGLSHDSDSAYGCEQYIAEHDDRGELECSSSAEKGGKGKWFKLSGGQSTEDLLNAFTKDLEAADEPQGKVKAAGSQRASSQQIKQPLTPAELDAQMASLAGPAAVREPDLVLVFGRTFTLAGYPPWPIRFSEIYHMGDLTDFTRRKLIEALLRYCRTPQRFGA